MSQQLKAENQQLKADNKSLHDKIAVLEKDNAGLALHLGGISAHAFNAEQDAAGMALHGGRISAHACNLEQRAATAESLNKNNVQIHDLQTQLKTFETECEALRSENAPPAEQGAG